MTNIIKEKHNYNEGMEAFFDELTKSLKTIKFDDFNPGNIQFLITQTSNFSGWNRYVRLRRAQQTRHWFTTDHIQSEGELKLFKIRLEKEQSNYYSYYQNNIMDLTFGLNERTGEGFLVNNQNMSEHSVLAWHGENAFTGLWNKIFNAKHLKDFKPEREKVYQELGDTPMGSKEYTEIAFVSDKGRAYLERLGQMSNELKAHESMNDVAYIVKENYKNGTEFKFTFLKSDGSRILGPNPGLTKNMVEMVKENGSLPTRESMQVIDQKGFIHVYSDSENRLWFEDTRDPDSGLMPFLRYQLGLGYRQGEVTDRLSLKQYNSEITFKGAEWDATSGTIKWVYQGQHHGDGLTSDYGLWEFNTGKDGVDTMKAYQRTETSYERTTGKGNSYDVGFGLGKDGVSLGFGYSWSTWEEFTENIPSPNEIEEREYDQSAGSLMSTHKFVSYKSEGHYNLERLLNTDLEKNPNGWVGGKAPGATDYYSDASAEGRQARERVEVESHGNAHLYEVNDSPWGRNELGHTDYSSTDRANEWWAEVEVEDSDNARAVLDLNGEKINPRSNEFGQMVAATQTELTTMESDRSIWREENCDLVTGEAILIAFKNDEGTLDIGEFKSMRNGLQLDRWAFQGVDQSHDKFSRIEAHFQMDLDPILGSEANGYTDNFDPNGWDLTQIVHSERPFPGGMANWGFRYTPYRLAAPAIAPPTNQEPWECDFASNTSSTPLDNFDIDRTQTAGL